MRVQQFRFCGMDMTVHSFNTVIVGTGAAGYNAAERLYQYGQTDIAMLTENILAGTSRNTGSDKQTYYKLSLSGSECDSVKDMAQVFFDGQCVDGEHALCEAALSAQCFLHLVELGVPFPRNRYGEFVGYKTDHDPSRRATSAGPYTSKIMTERLQESVENKNIRIYNHLQVLRILTEGRSARGLVCLNKDQLTYEIINCKNIIFATGGPAGMFADSAYPAGHYGATGIALEAGALGKNLTEWQFGLASIKPRWNVSGTYMQVLPCFISTDSDGGNPKEFLLDYFHDKGEMLSKIFLKGYQWPFDVRKVMSGSSIIDLLVYQESCIRGRRVFLDFRKNPGGAGIDFDCLSKEAYDYLRKAEACFGTPIDRLRHMNTPAFNFYLDKGIDLRTEMLEVALSAQHNNGGLKVDEWWQTNIEGLFAVGEASGTHGVYRPGGSALNSGQVGAVRAAQYIAARRRGEPEEKLFDACGQGIKEILCMEQGALGGQDDCLKESWQRITRRMSRVGAAIRNVEDIRNTRRVIEKEMETFQDTVKINSRQQLGWYFRLRETLICQYVYLSAMEDYVGHGGLSRGSSMYTDPCGVLPAPSLHDRFRYRLDDGLHAGEIQEVGYSQGQCSFYWRKVHPIPDIDDFFENVWRDFRKNKNIY